MRMALYYASFHVILFELRDIFLHKRYIFVTQRQIMRLFTIKLILSYEQK